MKFHKIFIVPTEPIETRYTCRWFINLPYALKSYIEKKYNNLNLGTLILHDHFTFKPEIAFSNEEHVFLIYDIYGDMKDIYNNIETVKGGFLDFAFTNVWKCEQGKKIADLFKNKKITDGSIFLFTDFWNPIVLQLKYMASLIGIDIKIHGIAHAGNYDPNDFLGRLQGNKDWIKNLELAFLNAYDSIYFATDFHINLFYNNLAKYSGHILDELIKSRKIVKSGQPHYLMHHNLKNLNVNIKEKENIILFPHRIAPEKQPEIFKDLAESVKEYKFIMCQEKDLMKEEYHELLAKSKIVFSANLQETLGISAMEGVLCKCIPVLPNRLSYTEMYDSNFLYPSEWTESFENYLKNKHDLIKFIKDKIENYYSENIQNLLKEQEKILVERYLNSDIMFENMLKDIKL